MRETLACERIDGGFRRQEAITRTFRIESEITVEREPDGSIAIRRRELSYQAGQPDTAIRHLALSTFEAQWLLEELTRVLEGDSIKEPDNPDLELAADRATANAVFHQVED